MKLTRFSIMACRHFKNCGLRDFDAQSSYNRHMKIVFDGRMLGWTGIGRYCQRVLDQLQELDSQNEYIVLIWSGDKIKWVPSRPNFAVREVKAAAYSVREQLELPWVLRQLKPDLVHFPHFTVPLLFNGPYVVTIHDLILVDFKNVRGDGLAKLRYEVKYFASRLVLSHAIRRARLVLTGTDYIKDRLAATFKIDTEQVATIPLGVDALAYDAPISGLPNIPYIFSLGNSYPYKNLDLLVEAFAASRFRHNGGKLILGGPDDYFRTELKARVKKLNLIGPVEFAGRVSDVELVRLYTQATLFVFPSLAEGFGLPGLEAMQYGTPVLSAKASCLPEVYGEAAAYFDPNSATKLTAAIDSLVNDQAKLAQLITLGHERTLRFEWKDTAERTLAAYRVAHKRKTD
jgi:glycosyltransferase involved in cell wall biosynthesis